MNSLEASTKLSGLDNIAAGGWNRPVAWLGRGLAGWHLLSVDAPTVAVVWTWFVARCAGVRVPAGELLAMFLAVWVLYVADRMLDAKSWARESELEERHRFHWKHRRGFGVGMASAAVALVPLVEAMRVRPDGGFWEFVGIGAALAGWFAVIHWVGVPGWLRGAKEMAPGVFFGAAVFLPTMMKTGLLEGSGGMAAVGFALVCWLNCRMIFGWEHEESLRGGVRWYAGALALMAAIVSALRLGRMSPVWAAVSLAAVGLLLLDGASRRLQRTTLRAAADLALLTPLLVVPLLK